MGKRVQLWVLCIVLAASIFVFWGTHSVVGPVQFGRSFLIDISTQTLAATTFAIVSGSLTALLAIMIGVPIGVGAAYYSGLIGAPFRAPVDILSSVPRLSLIHI